MIFIVCYVFKNPITDELEDRYEEYDDLSKAERVVALLKMKEGLQFGLSNIRLLQASEVNISHLNEMTIEQIVRDAREGKIP
jgi:hypothetical protein